MPAGAPVPGKGDICLGVIVAAFGVRGEVRIRSFTAQPEDIAAYGPLFAEDGSALRIESLRLHKGGGVVARLCGVAAREQAQALAGTHLYVARAALPDTGAEEWYHADIIGLAAYGQQGEACGRVKAVWDFGAGDMLELERDRQDGKAGRQSVMIPFTRANVAEVETGAGRIILTDMARRFEWQQA